MNLYLVQHATATTKEEDPRRPLSAEGKTEIKKTATYVAAHAGVTITRILHSGKTRAQQTAEVLGEHLKPAGGIDATDGLAPLDDPTVWESRLRDMNDDLMLVGHLPHLSRLAALLICGDAAYTVIHFRNAGVVCLYRSDADDWSVDWTITPELVP